MSISFSVPVKHVLSASYARSSDSNRTYLTGVFLEGAEGDSHVVSTNGHILIKVKTDDIPAGGYILPPDCISFLEWSAQRQKKKMPTELMAEFTIDGIKLDVTAGSLSFRGELIDATFPDYKRIIPEKVRQIGLHGDIGFSLLYFDKFSKSIKALYNPKMATLSMSIKGPHDPVLLSNSHPSAEGWIGVIMPIRV